MGSVILVPSLTKPSHQVRVAESRVYAGYHLTLDGARTFCESDVSHTYSPGRVPSELMRCFFCREVARQVLAALRSQIRASSLVTICTCGRPHTVRGWFSLEDLGTFDLEDDEPPLALRTCTCGSQMSTSFEDLARTAMQDNGA